MLSEKLKDYEYSISITKKDIEHAKEKLKEIVKEIFPEEQNLDGLIDNLNLSHYRASQLVEYIETVKFRLQLLRKVTEDLYVKYDNSPIYDEFICSDYIDLSIFKIIHGSFSEREFFNTLKEMKSMS